MVKKKSTELQVEYLHVDELKPYEKNSRTHSEAQLELLAKSIGEFGFTNPVLIDERGGIIAGHARVSAARMRGVDRVPCIRLRHLTKAQRRAYVIADNRLAEAGTGWDVGTLRSEIDDLLTDVPDFDLSAIGWVSDELKSIYGEDDQSNSPRDAEPRTAEAEELMKKWGTEEGQLWELGNHRLMCGDSRSLDNVLAVVGKTKATLVFTDPPYGVDIGGKNRLLNKYGFNKYEKGGNSMRSIQFDHLTPEQLKKELVPVFRNVRQAMADDCSVFVTSSQIGELGMNMMREAGLPIKHVLIWKKNHSCFSFGRLDYDYQHEPMLFTWEKKHKKRMKGPHKTSVWEISKPQQSKLHPTMKPVELVTNAILNHTDEDDVVLDPFCGSGTTILAAEQTGRRARTIEISPAWVAVSLQRFEDATSVTPTQMRRQSTKNKRRRQTA